MPISQGTQEKKNQDGPLWKAGATCTYLWLGPKSHGKWEKAKSEVNVKDPHVSSGFSWQSKVKVRAQPRSVTWYGKNSQTGPLLFQYNRALRRAGWLRRWAWKDSWDNKVSQWPRRNQRTLPYQRGVWKTAAKLKRRVAGTWLCCFRQFLYTLFSGSSLKRAPRNHHEAQGGSGKANSIISNSFHSSFWSTSLATDWTLHPIQTLHRYF